MNAILDSCSNCFHYNVCGSASIYNDVKLCKQFIRMKDILSGSAKEVVEKELARLQKESIDYERENSMLEYQIKELEQEVKLLRIIKQTLEMASGMTFQFEHDEN